jgi:hypothetical protein
MSGKIYNKIIWVTIKMCHTIKNSALRESNLSSDLKTERSRIIAKINHPRVFIYSFGEFDRP